MRNLIILSFFIFFGNGAKAQINADEKAVIHLAAGRGYHNHDFCFDNASMPAWVADMTSQLIKGDTSLHLSVAEIVEACNKLHAVVYAQYWQSPMLDSALVIKGSDIKKSKALSFEDYVKKKYPNLPYYCLYLFSMPVFIRNNTICFLHNITFSLCFNDPMNSTNEICPYTETVDMYIKKNNIWYRRRPWIFISNVN